MPDYSKRTGYAPWSLTREAGVQSATVNGTIEVPQTCQPTINTGVIDEKGNWQGVKANDEVFIGLSKVEAVAIGAEVLFPDTNNFPSIDMTGFSDIFIALKSSNTSAFNTQAVMGPDTVGFANLNPVNAGGTLRGNQVGTSPSAINDMLVDSAETLNANVWHVFSIKQVLKNQKNLQFKITNNSGGSRNIEFGFMRLV